MIARKPASSLAFIRQCLGLLAEMRGVFALFLVLSIVGALTEGITVSLLVPILETQGGPGGFSGVPLFGRISVLFAGFTPSGRIEAVAVAMAILVVLRNLLQYTIDWLAAVMPLQLEQKLSIRSYAALMAVEIGYVTDKEYGDLFNGISGYAQRVTNMLTNVAVALWNSLIIAIYVALMVAVSWRLTGLAVLFLLACAVGLRWLSANPMKRAGEKLSVAESGLNQVIMESITGMKAVRLAAAEPTMVDKFGRAIGSTNDAKRRSATIVALNTPTLSTAAGLFICVLLFGDALVHEGASTAWISSMLLFLFLLFRLMGPVGNVTAARTRILGHIDAFDRLTEFYRVAHERQETSGGRPVGPLREAITFEHVDFAYKAATKGALHDISVTIARGKMTAIVGPSGAGKTTLIALIARLYDPNSGRIVVDGVNLRDLDLRAWRQRFAVVAQDTFIFNDTAANNIALGRTDVPREHIRTAARFAAAAEFIAALPNGYDTVLGDRGVRLSGGQQQRIAIARAILVNPDLLILDEATSHLDTFTERTIQEAVELAAKDRTVLVIAHRLSTIRRADKVIVMDAGKIIEEGRHDELLARRGRYWEMVEHQRLDLISEEKDGADSITARAHA